MQNGSICVCVTSKINSIVASTDKKNNIELRYIKSSIYGMERGAKVKLIKV